VGNLAHQRGDCKRTERANHREAQHTNPFFAERTKSAGAAVVPDPSPSVSRCDRINRHDPRRRSGILSVALSADAL
jgi:hypothetical protein